MSTATKTLLCPADSLANQRIVGVAFFVLVSSALVWSDRNDPWFWIGTSFLMVCSVSMIGHCSVVEVNAEDRTITQRRRWFLMRAGWTSKRKMDDGCRFEARTRQMASRGSVAHELRCVRKGAKPWTVIRRVSNKLEPNADIVDFATAAGRMLAIPFVGYVA